MKNNRPYGVLIFAIGGMLYSFILMIISVIVLVFKPVFMVYLQISATSVYINFSMDLLLAFVFLFSSIMLIKKRAWAPILLIFALGLTITLEVLSVMIANGPDVQPVDMVDIIEVLIEFFVFLIMLWYFRREKVRKWLLSACSE